MTRREILKAAGAAAISLSAAAQPAPQTTPRTMENLGGAPAGFPIWRRSAGSSADFVEHCHSLGLGVVEAGRPPSDPEAIRKFRDRMERYHMRAIFDVGYPRDEKGIPAFEAGAKAAAECGALSLHAAMTQRRYEEFDTFEAFRRNFEGNQKSIALAEPILRKCRVRLGIENHKGWRSAEQAAWLKRVSSEWIGVHFDFGNNLALCEDPMDTLRNLQPFAWACHLKDMAVEAYDDGFLLSEVPLGEGVLGLPAMVAMLRKKDPNIPLDLEMITRDPLKIPVFTEKYWATFDDSYSPLPGRDLARTLDLVRKNKPKNPLPRVSGLSTEAQGKIEDDCIAKSLDFARRRLNG